MANKTKSKKSGYVPFSKEDINLQDGRNTRAEEIFLSMLDIPKRAAKKSAKGVELTDEDFYPTSLAETEKMQEMIEQVEAAVDDPSDRVFLSNVDFMKDVIKWSKKRHWTCSWIIAVCVFGVSIYCNSEAKDYRAKAHEIEAWSQQVTTEKQIADIARYEGLIKDYTLKADTVATKANKKFYLQLVDDNKEKLEKISGSWEDYRKEMASHPAQEANSWTFWRWFWIVMIGLYVIAERPYGYMISNRRVERMLLKGFRKIGFGIAGGLLGIAGGIKFTNIVTTYRNGNKTTSDDGSGPGKLAIMIILAIAAAIVIGVTSCAIIIYSVVMGILRNYNLLPKIKKFINSKRGETATNQPT